MTALERRRRVQALGERAVNYYIDTGLCVFCDADDVEGVAHADDCEVGVVAGVAVDEARRQEKAAQRRLLRQVNDGQPEPGEEGRCV